MIRKKFSYVLLFCCLSLLSTACKEDVDIPDLLVGTWQLTEVKVNEQSEDISDKTDLIQFQANSIYQSYNTTTEEKNRGGWSYQGNMLNISLDLPAAYYVETISENSLELKRFDFGTDGELLTTQLFYEKAADDLIP
ncbi:MAG: lipocalin family protein [Paludibacter sp.]|nr:lipocalin family protein [Paludibacter sp.]